MHTCTLEGRVPPCGSPHVAVPETLHPYTAMVSDRYVLTLSVVVLLVLVSRYTLPFLPLARGAAPMSVTDIVLFGFGAAGLAIHCGAMFFPSPVRALPGGHQVIRAVDPLGSVSIVWFAVAAALVVFGLRRQHVAAICIAAGSLAAVGYTMYDGGRLHVHLTAIFVAVVVLAIILSVLVIPPWRQGARDTHSTSHRLPAG
jgi:hypothetical protein